jgi:Exopolysaccharide biosynthesis protein YbjH
MLPHCRLTHPDHRALRLIALALALGAVIPAQAEEHPSLGFRGLPGLVDMPSAATLADANVSITLSGFGPVLRTTLAFQLSPRIEASFRYNSVDNWGVAPNSFYDANFDLRYRLSDQSGWMPAVTIGLQDFVGNGLNSAEYIVATHSVGQSLAVSAGLGWGRFASHGALFSTGSRDAPDLDKSGRIDLGQYFRGDVAAFGGVEWAINDKWTAKAEYSSDAYAEEVGVHGAFDWNSPYNFGLEYHANSALTLGAYYLYGSQIGLSANMVLNARQRLSGSPRMTAPEAILPRPDRNADPEAWAADWITTADAADQIAAALGAHLERPGIVIESVSVSGDTAQVRYRNGKIDAESQAIGRVARAMSQVLPASIEVFRIVPMVKGMPGTEVTLRRSDLEALEFVPDNGQALLAVAGFGPAHPPEPLLAFNPEVYPSLRWSVGPYAKLRIFDDALPASGNIGIRATASYEFAPGLILAASATKVVVGNLTASPADPSPLPPVRRDIGVYDTQGDPAVERLTAAWYTSLGPDLYGRVTVGYLERMFGGVSGEVLWRPTGKRWALGAELDYVAQRDPDQGFGFSTYDYQVATGHVSGYFDLGKGYHAQVDLGRYLAGDMGGTLTLTREFENGWRLGAFATLTDVSADDFGDGAFDKGVKLEIPVSWLLGNSTRKQQSLTLRPADRDGGARLDVDGRLFDLLHDYDQSGIEAQWDRVWK